MQFTRMPQGFKNSGAIFQRNMVAILGECIGTKCNVYLDKILVFGKSEQEHDQNFKEVTKKINEYGLEMNEKK